MASIKSQSKPKRNTKLLKSKPVGGNFPGSEPTRIPAVVEKAP